MAGICAYLSNYRNRRYTVASAPTVAGSVFMQSVRLFLAQYCTLGWSDFEEEKNVTHCTVCCAKLLLDPNSKISCLNVASFLGRNAFENLDFYPKIKK